MLNRSKYLSIKSAIVTSPSSNRCLSNAEMRSWSISKFLNPDLGIVKIRIVFTNGNIRDYELTGKRIKKFPEELRESYQQAMKGNAQKIHNSDDSTF